MKRDGESRRGARHEGAEGEAHPGRADDAGGAPSAPLLVIVAAVVGLLAGGVPVLLMVARRPAAPPPPAVAAAAADDGLSEEHRLRARASSGDARAMLALGRGLFEGAWGRRDEKEAERWLSQAIDSRDVAAADEAARVLDDLRRFVRTRRFEREADAVSGRD